VNRVKRQKTGDSAGSPKRIEKDDQIVKLLRRVTYWFKRRQLEAELAEELELHRSMKQQQLEQNGMPSVDATYASRRALGNVTLAREDARAIWIWPSLERLWQDVRFGARLLKRQPTFTATAILTLAIGIGATTTVFSVVEFEIWRPLPFPQPDRLVAIYTTGPGPRAQYDRASVAELVDLRARTHTFDGIAGVSSSQRRILRGRTPVESLKVMPVTANFFAVLQRSAALGRTFGASDAAAASDAIVLSDSAWRRHFGADPEIVGKGVRLDNRAYTVAGVTGAASLEFLTVPDAFVPIALTAAGDRTNREINLFGRLKDGVTLFAGDADLRAVAQQLANDHPLANTNRSARLEGLREAYTGWHWRQLFFFLGAAVFVLVLTCINVASLLLARALKRDREFAIRRALGGGQHAITQQLIVEGVLLTIPAAALALLIAVWAVDLLPRWLPDEYLSRGTAIGLDVRVYLFTFGVSALTALLFGLAPALLTSRRDLNPILVQGGRTVAGSRRQRRARHALVVGEVMMSLVLVVGAGLFVNSFVRLTHLPLGFACENRITLRMTLPRASYAAASDVVGFANRLLTQVRALPGIESAALGSTVPLDSGYGIRFVVSDRPRTPGEEPEAIVRSITSHYFETLGIRIVKGRDITDRDVTGAPDVAVINEQLARRLFPNENPVGRDLVLLSADYARWVHPGAVQIVGVVSNIKDVGINEHDFNDIFLPLAQHAPQSLQVVVHSALPTENVIDSVRHAIAALDRDLPVLTIKTMDQYVDEAFQSDTFNLVLITTFAVLAIVMAALGIYGAMAFAIEERTQEFGVRLALGAQRARILGLALGEAARLGTGGIVLGLGVSLVLARALGTSLYMVPQRHDGVLYEVSLSDPLTLTCACVLLLAVAALAGLVPARRAMRVDPVVALRAE
jgi:putative ABC transport system permease protein